MLQQIITILSRSKIWSKETKRIKNSYSKFSIKGTKQRSFPKFFFPNNRRLVVFFISCSMKRKQTALKLSSFLIVTLVLHMPAHVYKVLQHLTVHSAPGGGDFFISKIKPFNNA